jgi:flagellar protein FlaG
MASNVNEIITPVIEQSRNPVSSRRQKPTVGDSINLAQESNRVSPSPGGNDRVKEPSREDVEKALAKINDLAKSLSRELSFSYDDRIDKVVVKVMEGGSEKVIRQIPPEEMIRLSVKMDDIMGMLINQSV